MCVVIENEIGNSIGRDPKLVAHFFENLAVQSDLGYIWDIANQWQEGRFPCVDDYRILKPHIAMLHVKGGRWNNAQDREYTWAAQLADSDWPYAEICEQALQEKLLAICINPPHGKYTDELNYQLADDVHTMKNIINNSQEPSHV